MNDGGSDAPLVVVTGANSGIGLETARGLAAEGGHVVITSRDPDRGRIAVDDIAATTGVAVDLVPLDLASFVSIRACAAHLLEAYERLDVLIHNAGLAPSGMRWETAEGFEATFGVNHVGPSLLTSLLLDRLIASAPARIVIVSSGAHHMAPSGLCFDDLQHERSFPGIEVYAESKLANIYTATILAERLAGTGVTVNAVNPGYVDTQLSNPRPEDSLIGKVAVVTRAARLGRHGCVAADMSAVQGSFHQSTQRSSNTARASTSLSTSVSS